MADTHPLPIAVFVSGSGTNLQAILDAISAGDVNAEVRIVVSSRPDAYGIERARAAGIPTLVLDRAAYADPQAADTRIADELAAHGVEYVFLAGYMRLVTPVLLDAFPNRVVNLHPALLPSFQGAHAIADAYARGVKVTGITVHFANAEYDRGPIIAQQAVVVREDDSIEDLEARIHDAEHELYPKVVGMIANGCVSVDSRTGKVRVTS